MKKGLLGYLPTDQPVTYIITYMQIGSSVTYVT